MDSGNRIYQSDHYESLVQAIKSREAIAYIGSGLSQMGKTYISWPELVKKLCNKCNVDFPSDDNLDENDWLSLAEKAKENNLSEYCKTLKAEFATRAGTTPRIYTLLLQLPFLSYLTTNFDPTLHKAGMDYNAVRQKQEITTFGTPMCDPKKLQSKNIFYLHGLAEYEPDFNCDKLILSESDFKEAYEEDDTLKSFLFAVFKFNPVIFFGCRLKEEPIRRIFDACKRSQLKMDDSEKHFPPKYILLPSIKGKIDEPEQNQALRNEKDENIYYEELGINVIRYDPIPDFTKLEEIVEDWTEQTSNYVSSFKDQSSL